MLIDISMKIIIIDIDIDIDINLLYYGHRYYWSVLEYSSTQVLSKFMIIP